MPSLLEGMLWFRWYCIGRGFGWGDPSSTVHPERCSDTSFMLTRGPGRSVTELPNG
jgi:hypothetical protein